MKGGVARQDVATVETGEAVEGIDRSRKRCGIGLSSTQQRSEVRPSGAGREVDDGTQATEPGAAFGLVEVRAERTPGVAGGDHRPNSHQGTP